MGFLYVAVSLVSGALLIWGPFSQSLADLTISDYPYLFILAAHLVCGCVLEAAAGRARRSNRLQAQGGEVDGSVPREFYRIPEVLFVICLVFFIFTYLYALNANMDYVQRFIASGGAVRLALDTRQERLAACVRFCPLLFINGLFYLLLRLGRRSSRDLPSGLSRWALAFSLLSVLLSVAAFPSFLNLDGFGYLAFVALVPLLLVFQGNSWGWGMFYGLTFAVVQTMLLNHWLATYSLVTLQLVSLVFLLLYALFLAPTLWLYKRLPRLGFLILPMAWVAFDYLRSAGFIGYPWGFWGTTQYQFASLVQIASFTGVWGVSFIVVLMNSGLAAAIGGLTTARSSAVQQRRSIAVQPRDTRNRGFSALLIASTVFLFCLVLGTISLALHDRKSVAKHPRLALVQQNADPRKHDYRKTFSTLVSLTDRAEAQDPDLVVWSETAFVPNIRRWSKMDPEKHSYAALVRDFLDYQRSLGRWLVTGNDDYELVSDGKGGERRLDYNAAILFDPQGRRVKTYRKVRLVPFTEHFPWKEELPRLYRWLERRDVYLWEPGRQRSVFQHPLFQFATPICFEDAFPGDVRLFVRAGAEAIVNLSNDYWSLTEVEGKQHGINAFYRAVENRVPLVRAAASGLTGYVDSGGRLRAALPYYEEEVLVVDVELKDTGTTLYTLLGDWFPWLLLCLYLVFLILSLFPRIRDSL